MAGVAHPPWSNFNQWRPAKLCRDRRPLYHYGAGLTVVPVLSRPTPPGPQPLHGGKRPVAPSLLVRVSFFRAHLWRPTNRERLTPPDRVAPRASSADARHLRHPSRAAQAHSSCRYYGPSAASGFPGEADAPRALYSCGRPRAWPPSQLMLQVPTFSLPWQCRIVRCP